MTLLLGAMVPWSVTPAAREQQEAVVAGESWVDLASFEGAIIIDTDDALRKLDDFSIDLSARLGDLRNGHLVSLQKQWDQDGFYLQLYDGRLILGFGADGAVTEVASAPNSLEPGRWYRISATKDDDQARLYLDGKPIGADLVATDVVDSPGDLKIGTENYSASMAIRHFRFWDKALPGTTIADLGDPAVADAPLSEPMIHYTFEEGAGSILENQAGDRYSAMISGAAEGFGWSADQATLSALDDAQAPSDADKPKRLALKLGPDGHRLDVKGVQLDGGGGDVTLQVRLKLDERHPGVIATAIDSAGSLMRLEHDGRRVWLDLGARSAPERIVSPNGILEPETTMTLAAVQEGDIAFLFVNGVQVASYRISEKLVFSNLALTLGAYDDAASIELLDLGIWDRALSADDLQAGFDRPAIADGAALALLYGPFTQLRGDKLLRDRSRAGHDGRIEGEGDAWIPIEPPSRLASSATAPRRAVKDAAFQFESETRERFDLPLGGSRIVTLDRPVEALMVDDPNIMRAQMISPRKIYLFGDRVGHTSVIALDGRQRLIGALDVRVAPDAEQANGELNTIEGAADNRYVERGGRLVMEGEVDDVGEGLALRAHAESNARRGVATDDATVMTGAQQVNIRVRFAEVSRSDVTRLGINWSAVISPGEFVGGLVSGDLFLRDGVATGSGTAFASLDSGNLDINVLLDALQQEGALTMLAEPNLTVLNGEEANFLAGGELPVPVPQNDTGSITVEFRPFGVSLRFRPTLLADNRISLDVDSEVSDISTAGAVQLADLIIPAFNVRRAETTLEMASGQTFAVGGLYKRTLDRSIEAFPGLGSIPILGALFRSTRYNRSETELVILITPYLVRPVSEQDALVVPGQPARSARHAQTSARPAMGFSIR